MMLDLRGRHVVVTGASSGIGKSLALALAGEGARVTLIARRKEALDALANEIEAAGGKAFAVSADVGIKESVEAAMGQARAVSGPVDVLVANAGIGRNMNVKKLDTTLVEETMQINFMGVVYATCAVLPEMIERNEGTIVAVSSLAAWRGLPTSAPYCASKAAVTAWMEGLRTDLHHTNVQMSTCHPGFIRTPMTDKNKFKMPFLMEVDDAATALVKGIRKGGSEINFPWRLVTLMRLVRFVPNWLFDRAVGRRV
jgi:short-subunit dehydrogenase